MNASVELMQITTILRGVTQERRGDLGIESYQRKLLNPQALQFDTRIESLSVLYFSDYETGYIYKVGAWESDDHRCSQAVAVENAWRLTQSEDMCIYKFLRVIN